MKKYLVFFFISFFLVVVGLLIYYNQKHISSNIVSANKLDIDRKNILQYIQNPELQYFNVTLDNGLKISYRGYAVTYQPVFVMQNDATYKWGDIPSTIGKDLWKTQISGNEYKWGVDFSNVSTNIKNNLKWVVLERTNATKTINGSIVSMTLDDIEEKIRKEGNIIINWKEAVPIKFGIVKFFANDCIVLVEETERLQPQKKKAEDDDIAIDDSSKV